MDPFINNNGGGCIPSGGGDSWNFQISEGPRKHQRLATLSPLTQLGSNGAWGRLRKGHTWKEVESAAKETTPAITCREDPTVRVDM